MLFVRVFLNFYPIIKFTYDNRQHEQNLNTRVALFLGALALKMELVKFMFFVRFFFSCHILSCSLRGPATQPLHNEGRSPESSIRTWTTIFVGRINGRRGRIWWGAGVGEVGWWLMVVYALIRISYG